MLARQPHGLIIRLFAGRDAGAGIAARLRARGETVAFLAGAHWARPPENTKLAAGKRGEWPQSGRIGGGERERAAFVAAQREMPPEALFTPPLKAIMRMQSVLLTTAHNVPF